MADNREYLEEIFGEMLADLHEQIGDDISEKEDELAAYAAERADHLSTIVDEPGFAEAVKAETDNVMLEAGLAAVAAADELDGRVFGIIQGALLFAARLLVR